MGQENPYITQAPSLKQTWARATHSSGVKWEMLMLKEGQPKCEIMFGVHLERQFRPCKEK